MCGKYITLVAGLSSWHHRNKANAMVQTCFSGAICSSFSLCSKLIRLEVGRTRSPHQCALRRAQNASAAASTVSEMSSSEWESETKAASNWEGARYTPLPSMSWKKRE